MPHAITAKTDTHPDGKGVSGFMLDWYRSQPRDVLAKPQQQLLAEMFTSMLALSAEFKYRPAIETKNYLYWIDEQWSLSLIAPDEWSAERQASFAGTLVLQQDMTWTISPSDQLSEQSAVSEALRDFHEAFVDILETDKTLEEVLPFYVGHLPYYQRLYASALSRSLRASLRLGGLDKVSCKRLLSRTPQLQREAQQFSIA